MGEMNANAQFMKMKCVTSEETWKCERWTSAVSPTMSLSVFFFQCKFNVIFCALFYKSLRWQRSLSSSLALGVVWTVTEFYELWHRDQHCMNSMRRMLKMNAEIWNIEWYLQRNCSSDNFCTTKCRVKVWKKKKMRILFFFAIIPMCFADLSTFHLQLLDKIASFWSD